LASLTDSAIITLNLGIISLFIILILSKVLIFFIKINVDFFNKYPYICTQVNNKKCMWDTLPIFKSIEIIKHTGLSISYYSTASILITGDYMIIIKKDLTELGNLNHTQHDIINLSEIKSYKTK
jgi:hypothetical protein